MVKERKDQIIITYKGKTQNLKKWCKELNWNYSTIYYRLKRGVKEEELFDEVEKDPIIYRGKEVTIKEIEEVHNIRKATFYSRIRSQWSIEDAIETPIGVIPISKQTPENMKYSMRSWLYRRHYFAKIAENKKKKLDNQQVNYKLIKEGKNN